MQPSDQLANPYSPPVSTSRRIAGLIRSFKVGHDKTHTVFVESSFWTGLTTHVTDQDGVAGPPHKGACRFEVGSEKPHYVQIEVDEKARVNAYVDGRLIQANMFEKMRATIFFRVGLLIVILLIAIGLFLFGFLGFDKTIENWFETWLN